MDNEQSFKQIKNPEQEKWLDEHIVLNRQFVDEARRFGIKPLTNMFWVYQQHRSYEKFGKFGFCVAGVDKIAEDCSLTKKQVLDSYTKLMEKGAIHHIWCDSKVYRNKTKIYVSQPLIDEKRMVITENMLARTVRQKQIEGDKSTNIDQSSKIDYQSSKIDLNNYNKQLDITNNIDTKVSIGASAELATYGNPEINEMFSLWDSMFGYKQKESRQNRNACHTMLTSKSKGKEWLINTMKIMREARKDKYAPKEVKGNAGFFDLQKNCDYIWNWGSAKNEELQSNRGVIEI